MGHPPKGPKLPAFPRSRPYPAEQLTSSRMRRLRRLQLIVLLLQLGCLGLLIRTTLVEPRPFCRLQQWSSSPRPANWPFTHLN